MTYSSCFACLLSPKFTSEQDDLYKQMELDNNVVICPLMYFLNWGMVKRMFFFSWAMSPTTWVELLTHWGQDRMAAISQATFSKAFSWTKMHEFCLRFLWNLFLRFELALCQHWHLVSTKPLSEPMMVILLMHICVTWPHWVNFVSTTIGDVWITPSFRIYGHVLCVEHISCVIMNCSQHQRVIPSFLSTIL